MLTIIFWKYLPYWKCYQGKPSWKITGNSLVQVKLGQSDAQDKHTKHCEQGLYLAETSWFAWGFKLIFVLMENNCGWKQTKAYSLLVKLTMEDLQLFVCV